MRKKAAGIIYCSGIFPNIGDCPEKKDFFVETALNLFGLPPENPGSEGESERLQSFRDVLLCIGLYPDSKDEILRAVKALTGEFDYSEGTCLLKLRREGNMLLQVLTEDLQLQKIPSLKKLYTYFQDMI